MGHPESILGVRFGGEEAVDLIDSVANVTNLARLGVGNGHAELFFEREEEVGGVKAVDGVFVEGAIDGDFVWGNTFDRGNLGNDPGGQVAIHASSGRETK